MNVLNEAHFQISGNSCLRFTVQSHFHSFNSFLFCIRHGSHAHLPSYTVRYLAYELLSFIFTHNMGNNGLKGKQSGKSFWK